MAESSGDVIADLETILSTITEGIHSIDQRVGMAREMLEHLHSVQTQEVSMEDQDWPETDEKLSPTAKSAIEATGSPLEPEVLKKFLLEDAFGKPKPNVLPIARQYTDQLVYLIEQLKTVRDRINQSHHRYLTEQRRLDVNLNNRIDRLVGNMRRELEKEAAEGRSQMSMDSFVVRGST